MRRRAVLRWLTDWRNGATLLGTLVVAIVVVSYVEAVRSRAQALHTAQVTAEQALDSRQAATRRIDQLGQQLGELQGELRDADVQRAAVYAQLEAVIAQLRQLGAEPVATPADYPSPTPTSTTRPSPRPSPTPTTRPSPRPSPTPTCRPIPVIGCQPTGAP